MSNTVIKYGNDLLAGVRQPGSTIHMDAYGLVQSQIVYAIDNVSLSDYLDIFNGSIVHPDSGWLGFEMRSYKYDFVSNKGSVTYVTVDFMGINRTSGHTDAQLNGVSTSSAQPIETHPNFTKRTDSTIGTSSDPLAGTPNNPYHRAIFNPVDNGGGTTQYTFGGFGVETDPTLDPNKKAGVRQFLRPMQTFRGQMFFAPSQVGSLNALLSTVGRTFYQDSDVGVLLAPMNTAKYKAEKCLLTAANVEVIGRPVAGDVCAVKINYDIMFSPYDWDSDIYGKGQSAIF